MALFGRTEIIECNVQLFVSVTGVERLLFGRIVVALFGNLLYKYYRRVVLLPVFFAFGLYGNSCKFVILRFHLHVEREARLAV